MRIYNVMLRACCKSIFTRNHFDFTKYNYIAENALLLNGVFDFMGMRAIVLAVGRRFSGEREPDPDRCCKRRTDSKCHRQKFKSECCKHLSMPFIFAAAIRKTVAEGINNDRACFMGLAFNVMPPSTTSASTFIPFIWIFFTLTRCQRFMCGFQFLFYGLKERCCDFYNRYKLHYKTNLNPFLYFSFSRFWF